MRTKVTVIGAHETARTLAERDYADIVETVEELPGSDVVVIGDDTACADIARHAPAAVVVVTADADVCGSVLTGTLFPRGRVIGAAGDGVGRIVDAIVLDRGVALDCLAQGPDRTFVPATARIGAAGIEELL